MVNPEMEGSGAKPEAITARKAGEFSEWYVQAIIKSGFVDYSTVSGMLVYRPDCYFAWDTVREQVDRRFKEEGIEDTYFPSLIPERLLQKEQQHVEGFTPEVAWVTRTGDTELEERLAVRPTSETIMYDSFAKWIRSWRDLPLRLNQWNNVIRWEFKHPTPLLRTREFLWNEGHTAFATQEEADSERDVVLKIYIDVLRDCLALPGIIGRKTDKEKFAGAVASYSIELIMPDGWAIQGPDWHSDGQNFSKAFGIKFIDKDGKEKFAYQNTFAISTRVLGAMVAAHGDDRGLVLPPKAARRQIVVVPIYNNSSKDGVLEYSKRVRAALAGFRVHLDDRDGYSPGWKFNEWEMRGVPLRIEVGKRELDSGSVYFADRLTGEKRQVPFSKLASSAGDALESIQKALYDRAEHALMESVHAVNSYQELVETVNSKGGFAQAPWCGSVECEDKIKDGSGIKATNMPLGAQDVHGKKCVVCGRDAKHIVNFAKSY